MDDASFFALASSEARQQQDASLLVRFEWSNVPDAEETAKAGYPCTRRVETLRIRIPGSQEERVSRVSDEQRRRFPRAYAAFKAGQDGAIDGTPLKECAILGPNEVSMLNHHGVVSVEQAAALSDENLSGMGHGVRAIRDRVKTWVEARKSHKPVAEMQAALREKDEQIESLSKTVSALSARMEALISGQPLPDAPPEAAPKRKRGRPAKIQPEG